MSDHKHTINIKSTNCSKCSTCQQKTKHCKSCHLLLPISSFHYGRRACKDCRKKVNQAYYSENKHTHWNVKNSENI